MRHSPDQILELVAADLAAKPLPRTTRYLSLDDLPDEKSREKWQAIMNGHLHSLSGEPGIALPDRVGVLLRFNATDYGDVFATQWERLGGQEPFWHGEDLTVEDEYKEVEYGYWQRPGYPDRPGGRRQHPDETWVTTRTAREKVAGTGKAVRRFFVRTPKGKAALETIAARTGGTDVPVVRATWFLAQTAVSFKRDPGYYEFIGVKDLKTFEKAIGFVRKDQNPAFLRDVRAAIGVSGITTDETLRRVIRFQAPNGGYWITQDSNQLQAKDKNKSNPLVNFGDDYEFQAAETIGYGPNGFPKTGLFDANGTRQDFAPPEIVSNIKLRRRDGREHVNLTCTGCHLDGYLQDVDDWVRSDLNVKGLLGTKLGEKKARDLRSQYVTQHIEPHLEGDRGRYTAVLWQATKMKPDDYAKVYVKGFEDAAELPVTQEYAARQLGVTKERMVEVFTAQGEKLDIALVPLRNDKPRSLPVVTWQNSFQRAADAVHGVSRPYKVREVKE